MYMHRAMIFVFLVGTMSAMENNHGEPHIEVKHKIIALVHKCPYMKSGKQKEICAKIEMVSKKLNTDAILLGYWQYIAKLINEYLTIQPEAKNSEYQSHTLLVQIQNVISDICSFN